MTKNKSGLVFTLDAVIAIIVTITFISATTHFISQSEQDPLPKIQLVGLGADIIKILEQEEAFDKAIMENNILDLQDALDKGEIKPNSTGMKIWILNPSLPYNPIIVGDLVIPKNKLIISGKRMVTISGEDESSANLDCTYNGDSVSEVKCFRQINYTLWKK